MTEPWLSADDIVAQLGVTQDTGCAKTAEKHMPARKVGRLRKLQASAVGDRVRGHGAAGSDDNVAGD